MRNRTQTPAYLETYKAQSLYRSQATGKEGKARLKGLFIQKHDRGLNRVPARTCIIIARLNLLSYKCLITINGYDSDR